MKKKIIVFDLDGVLFDSTKVVEEFLMGTYPTMTRQIAKDIMTGNFHEEMDKFKLDNKPVERTPEEKDERKRQYSERKAQSPIFPGIKGLLERLYNSGYTLVVNTSAVASNSIPLFEQNGVKNLFDFIATAEVSKSKLEKFKMIMEKYGVSEENLLFVTDTLGDVREADLAQVPTIAVTWGAHDRSYFEREHNDNLVKIVDSVEDLEKIILTV